MKTKSKAKKAMIATKLLIILVIGAVLPTMINLSKMQILQFDFLLNFIGAQIGLSLALLAIFFTLIEKYKDKLGKEKFNIFFTPIINEFKDDIKSYFGMLIIIIIASFFPFDTSITLFSYTFKIVPWIGVSSLLLSIIVLWDILNATLKLIKFISEL